MSGAAISASASAEISAGTPSTRAAPGWAQQWSELVRVAMLGTDRRPLGPLPPGPLADLFDGGGSQTADDAARLLDRAGALAAVRRAGLRPEPPPPPLPPCPLDERPPCPPPAARRLGELLEAWPVLVDEWLTVLVEQGYRLPPEHAVTLLERHRTDTSRRALVEQAAGPLAAWLVARFPDRLAARRSGTREPSAAGPGGPPGAGVAGSSVAGSGPLRNIDVGQAAELPADLLALLELPADRLADALAEGLVGGRFVARHRPLLLRVVCRLERDALLAVAVALTAVTAPGPALLAGDLAVLARTRLDLRDELCSGAAPVEAASGADP